MFRQSKFLIALAVIAAVFVGPALAAEATATVNVRSGPGTAYGVVDVLRPGQRVDIDHCLVSGWCYVEKSGPDGWVSRRYLTETGVSVPQIARPANPDVSISFSVPGFSFSFGDSGFSVRPPVSGYGSVCFYEHVNYRGDSFCLRPGQDRSALGSWDNRISSIDVSGGAEALICEDRSYRGLCVRVTRDISNLGVRGNDRISSIRVR